MSWNYRRGDEWRSPTLKRREGDEWVTISGGGGGGTGSGAISVGSPGETIFASPLDSQEEIDRFNQVSYSSNISIVNDPGGEDRNVTAIYVAEDDVRGGTVAYDHPEPHPEEVYTQYYLRFDENGAIYDPRNSVHGTKLPGVGGFYGGGGSGGNSADGESWSARIQNEETSDPTNNPGFRQMWTVYHMDYGGSYGDLESWDGEFALGEWHEVTCYVKMNTPGQNDGILRGWMNGDLCYERENFRFRDENHPNSGVTRSYAAYIYWGGSWGSPVDQNVYFKDFTVAEG